MASLSARGRGAAKSYAIQWSEPDGTRPTLTLGRVPKAFAEQFHRRVERLVEARRFGESIDRATAAWLAELAAEWRAKLVEKGLAPEVEVATLEQLCDYVIAQGSAAGNAASTLDKLEQAKRNLLEFFDAGRAFHTLTPGDAEEFRAWLALKGHAHTKGRLADSTVANRCLVARQFFAAAVQRRWLVDNPFAELKQLRKENEQAGEYVPLETVEQVMRSAPPDLVTMLALARIGGVRTPTESLALRWEWVNFEENTIAVFSQKNQRHAHKRERVIPLYGPLRPYLEAARDRAPEGAVHVVEGRLREITSAAVYNQLKRICLRAGVLPWASLWQSLRKSRATDLIDEGFPEHVVCYWQNDNPRTLRRHYLRVTKDHFRRAVEPAEGAAVEAEPAPAS